MWTAEDSKIFFQRRFCLAEVSLFRRRPETARAPRAAAVKHGRRPPPEAARSVLDRGEHDANLDWAGALSCRRRLPRPFRKRRSLLAKLRSVAPLCPACDATFAAGHHGCAQACQAPICFGVLEARNRVRCRLNCCDHSFSHHAVKRFLTDQSGLRPPPTISRRAVTPPLPPWSRHAPSPGRPRCASSAPTRRAPSCWPAPR